MNHRSVSPHQHSFGDSEFPHHTILVVDDVDLSRQQILLILEYIAAQFLQSQKQIQFIVSEACNGVEALEFMDKNDVDILIVDVQMPAMNGFQVISALQAKGKKLPVIIFVTASEKYALQAFDVSAVDYLLKPFTIERFEEAFKRALERLISKEQKEHYERLLEVVAEQERTDASVQDDTSQGYWQRLSLRSGKRNIVVAVEDIFWIGSAESYIEIHLAKHTYLFRDSLRNAEMYLDPSIFVRVHRSALVNVKKIKSIEYNDHGDGNITLVNGTKVKVSRYKKESLLALFAGKT